MGKILTALKRLPKRTSAIIAVVLAAIIIPATLFAWGPDRKTFTMEHPADYVTFNSITNNPNIGDERNFVSVRDAADTNGLWQDNVNVQKGKEYTVRMYVHNNAASNLNLVAQDVTARFNLPTTTGKSVQVDGSVTASNATPQMVYDHAGFTGSEDFNLAYVPGTLKYQNNVFGSNGVALPESIFDQRGALLGYDKLDGKIPGCLQYAGYLTFKVKPQFAPTNDFEMSKQVRKSGAGNPWQENVSVKPGDNVDFQIQYKNTGETVQKDVIAKDQLPAGLSYVAGTTYVANSANPNGIKVGDNLTQPIGINIGNYDPNGNAYIKFTAKVTDNDALPKCGDNLLTNKAFVIVDSHSKDDTASVNVPKECKPECKYSCDSLTVTKVDRTHFKFSTNYTVQNATLKKIEYVIRDQNGTEVARQTSPDYTTDKVGKFTVEAVLTINANGKDEIVTSPNCKKPFEVEEQPKTPVYTCDSLTFTKISRSEYSFDGAATAKDGATIVNYTFDFGDQTAPQTVTTPTGVKHTYAKDGTYTAKLTVKVSVNGEEKTVTSAKCEVKVIVTPEECKPGIPVGDDRCKEECKPGIPVGDERCTEKPECKPGIPMGDERCNEKPECKPGIPMGDNRCNECKPGIPMNDEKCNETPVTPTELPKTGSSDGIVALLGAGSLIAALGYYIASRRALS